MLKQSGRWGILSSPMLPVLLKPNSTASQSCTCMAIDFKSLKLSDNQIIRSSTRCKARRRVRYGKDEDDDEEEYGHNQEIAMLEFYSQSARGEALLVRALVDEQEVEVLIFKGFSSCLSYRTSPDPSRSVLPARAVIKSIDRIRGPFDPSNIEYIERNLTWEAFNTTRLS